MKFTLSWLKQFLDTEYSAQAIADKLTMIGLEVEELIDRAALLDQFEVAEIITTSPHPASQKLQICSVKTASEILQIICGASNARAGIKVVLAKINTVIPTGNFTIKKAKICGIESHGMLCAFEELGLKHDGDGIIELPNHAIIGDKIARYLGIDDIIFHINVTPNRADALGVYGIARDLAAAGLGTLKSLDIPVIKSSYNSDYSLTIENQSLCPLFAIRQIKNIKNQSSPDYLQKLLKNIGIAPVNLPVDVTNYISYSFGQPLHVYNANKIKDGLVVGLVENAASFQGLNEQLYDLPQNSLIITDHSGSVQCLAGILGANHSACDLNSTNILLEAAIFDPVTISQTGRMLNIITDSRYRFERHVDQEFCFKALDIATQMILDICGGEASDLLHVGNPSAQSQHKIKFAPEFLLSKSGIKLDEEQIITILSKLGFTATKSDNYLYFNIPSWRHDINIAEDLVEEILRIYGYDNIPVTQLQTTIKPRIISQDYKRISLIKRILATLGYDEVITWSFTNSKKLEFFSELKDELFLKNPISSELNYMRPSILPNVLNICTNNLNRSLSNLSLFEVGPIFKDTSTRVVNNVCGIRIGTEFPVTPHGNREFDVFDIKADIATILQYCGQDINKCKISSSQLPSYYHPTRSASISLGKELLGYFGQIHPSIAQEFGIKANILAFELFIEAIPVKKSKFGKRNDYEVSQFQPIVRDYSFIVEKDLEVGKLLSLIKNIDKNLIRNVELFDIYTGNNVENTKKSVAISVHIQAQFKTLTSEEIETINNKILKAAQEHLGAILREH
ncbi:MAG: phenylalanine--tRNA ligase subunit beta [Rickettsiaceae bacterium]|nr:phenylalanine--tRNA ligase subunit beta [Rickettsiaceae bacterium]